ncbi:AAA family ATPase [Streptomyces roseicoloratus]|uniref:AAA family ATPase n=1 Tax=Streptomyces roseicoloratus TaxID=2508722 RepID=A0ABY9S2V8_9ACTN|nr:AAA family ATPase [Streptomyces roseicoloratus]WMX47759.1 AAA family ATPase [Streptomyces roseicoloratus]
MKRYGHGLVVGRFRLPHAGHHHLVRTARERCERLTVVVHGTAAESPPPADRVAWMREIHPDALVVDAADEPPGGLRDLSAALPAGLSDAEAWDARAALVRAAVPEPVDAVFTAAPYGQELARRLGAASVRVEPGPAGRSLTSAAVRADPVAHWDALEAPVRAALARRVVVLGAERTGATTLALALTDHYRRRGGVWARTRCVPDHGRAYEELRLAELRAERPGAGRSDVRLHSADFPVIALRQAELEEEAARAGSPVLVCDSDAFAATIRHERHLGTSSPGTGEIAARGRQHLWLLTDHRGIALADDGPGDGPGDGRGDGRGDAAQLRPWMTARLLTRLARTGRRTVVLTGPHEERLATAVAAVDALLAEARHVTDPLPEHR